MENVFYKKKNRCCWIVGKLVEWLKRDIISLVYGDVCCDIEMCVINRYLEVRVVDKWEWRS